MEIFAENRPINVENSDLVFFHITDLCGPHTDLRKTPRFHEMPHFFIFFKGCPTGHICESALSWMFLQTQAEVRPDPLDAFSRQDRKSTRLNSSHSQISYAVFC